MFNTDPNLVIVDGRLAFKSDSGATELLYIDYDYDLDDPALYTDIRGYIANYIDNYYEGISIESFFYNGSVYGYVNGNVVQWLYNLNKQVYHLYINHSVTKTFISSLSKFYMLWLQYGQYNPRNSKDWFLHLNCRNHTASDLDCEFAFQDLNSELDGLETTISLDGRSGGNLCVTRLAGYILRFQGEGLVNTSVSDCLNWLLRNNIDFEDLEDMTKILDIIKNAVDSFVGADFSKIF